MQKISFDLDAQPLKCIEILLDISAQKEKELESSYAQLEELT